MFEIGLLEGSEEANLGLNRPMPKNTRFYLYLRYLWGKSEEILRIDASLMQRHKPVLKIYVIK